MDRLRLQYGQKEVLIDVTRLVDRALRGRRPTGVDRVGLAYVRHFQNRARALVRVVGRWVVLDRSDSMRLFAGLLDPQPGFAFRARAWVGRHYVGTWSRPKAGSVLLHVGHAGLERPDYGERVRRYGLRPLYFLHDLIPISFPEYCRPGEAEKHRLRLEVMLQTGCGLIVNSQATGAALEAYAASIGQAVPPVLVAHLAAPDFPPPAAERPLAEPYFVTLGTIEPRKNHLLLLHLWRQLAGQLGREAPRLVVIGQLGWECEQVVDMLERCTALDGLVVHIPGCDDASLATWLYHAQALLFPSFAEGYGIPLVEALSLGTPVIASDLPVFRELAGDIPEYCDPLDGPAWQRAVLDYAAAGHTRRLAQKQRLSHWRAPGWQEHFAKVEAFMAHCLRQSGS